MMISGMERIRSITRIIRHTCIGKGSCRSKEKTTYFCKRQTRESAKLFECSARPERPTISKLSEEGWYGVNTVIDKNEFIKDSSTS